MNQKDKDALRVAAEAATSGPWAVEHVDSAGVSITWKPGAPICHMRWAGGPEWKQVQKFVEADATHIALANPSAVLSLLAENARLEKIERASKNLLNNLFEFEELGCGAGEYMNDLDAALQHKGVS